MTPCWLYPLSTRYGILMRSHQDSVTEHGFTRAGLPGSALKTERDLNRSYDSLMGCRIGRRSNKILRACLNVGGDAFAVGHASCASRSECEQAAPRSDASGRGASNGKSPSVPSFPCPTPDLSEKGPCLPVIFRQALSGACWRAGGIFSWRVVRWETPEFRRLRVLLPVLARVLEWRLALPCGWICARALRWGVAWVRAARRLLARLSVWLAV